MESRFLRACARKPVDSTPVWFMRQAGRYLPGYQALRRRHSILELAKSPELACQVTMEPVKTFPLDAAIIFADILLPLEPMGVRVDFKPGPVLGNPVRSARDVEALRDCDPEKKMPFLLEAIRLARQELSRQARPVPLIGFAGAPFTLASYLIEGGASRDFLKTKTFIHENPRAWDRLMNKLSRVVTSVLAAQARAGAQTLQVFDSWIGALSPECFRRHVLPHSRRVFAALKPLGVPLVNFGTGTAGFLEDFASAGGDVVGIDWRTDIGRACEILRGRAVQGNLDPALLFAPKAVLKEAVSGLLARAGKRKGFIFNLGHGILPGTPVESVRAVVDWVHRFRA